MLAVGRHKSLAFNHRAARPTAGLAAAIAGYSLPATGFSTATSLSPTSDMTEVASMMVRDRRDTTGGTNGVYQVAGVTPSSC